MLEPAKIMGWLPWLMASAEDSMSRIMEVYKGGEKGISVKEDDSPLTIADTVSDGIFRDALAEHAGDIPVISEEMDKDAVPGVPSGGAFWLLDPLDGTKEFIAHNGEFTVNLALIESARPVFGMIGIPAAGEIYYAVRGQGVYVSRRGAGTERLPAFQAGGKGPARALVSRSHLNGVTERFIARLSAEAVTAGSALKFLRLACSEAEIYPRLGPVWPWDMAAGHLICEEAGLEVFGLKGGQIEYQPSCPRVDGFIVCGPAMKETALTVLEELSGGKG